jgi:hypothetical protein
MGQILRDEENKNGDQAYANKNLPCTICGGRHDAQLCVDKPSASCFICGGAHWIARCPKAKCGDCGITGHTTKRCPNKQHQVTNKPEQNCLPVVEPPTSPADSHVRNLDEDNVRTIKFKGDVPFETQSPKTPGVSYIKSPTHGVDLDALEKALAQVWSRKLTLYSTSGYDVANDNYYVVQLMECATNDPNVDQHKMKITQDDPLLHYNTLESLVVFNRALNVDDFIAAMALAREATAKSVIQKHTNAAATKSPVLGGTTTTTTATTTTQKNGQPELRVFFYVRIIKNKK